jgi:hypothetical protein
MSSERIEVITCRICGERRPVVVFTQTNGVGKIIAQVRPDTCDQLG